MVATTLDRPAEAVATTVALPDWLPTQPPEADPAWQQHAACHTDANPDRWTDLPPLRAGRAYNTAYDERLADLGAVCASCAVRVECAWDSLTNDVDGVWASLDEFDRADIRDLLNLPDPTPLSVFVISDPETDRQRERDSQRFTARRLARQRLTNVEISRHLGVSAMTVGRLLDDRDAARRTKTA